MQIIHLSSEHPLIINLWQGIQFLTELLELDFYFFILNLWQLPEVRVLRMQGIDADTIIRIAVLPCLSHIGIVDWQYLDDMLVGLVRPVDHHFQITEIAYTETALTAEGEDRDDGSGSLPRIDREESLRKLINDNFPFFDLW